MVFIESTSYDPAFNLALEQYIFDTLPRDQEYFMLCQNDNAVIVGKHQNTTEEINMEYAYEHGIKVVRRLSGGGAVYHDMGDINFTFVADSGNIDKLNMQAFCRPVVRALETLGVCAQIRGRNDITIEGKKFSGNSQYRRDGRVMHHGTLLFDSNLVTIDEVFRVPPDKTETKGMYKTGKNVTNIRSHLKDDISIDTFKEVLKENMVEGWPLEDYYFSFDDLMAINEIKHQRYNSWDWNFKSEPEFDIKKVYKSEACGKIAVSMNIKNSKLAAYKSHGDYFGEGDTKDLKHRLIGTSLDEKSLRKTLEGFDLDRCYSNLTQKEFITLLLQ